MFISHFANLDVLSNGDIKVSGLRLVDYSPWFLVDVAEKDLNSQEIVCKTLHILAYVCELESLSSKAVIEKVSIMRPSYLNNSNGWSLDTLIAIDEAKEEDRTIYTGIYRFLLESGELFEYDINGLNRSTRQMKFETIMQFCN